MIRVTGGKYKGLKLEFKSNQIRPTQSKLREAVFNMLKEDLEYSTFIDAFAGSGIMGIEALSRSVDFVHFNDISQVALNNIKDNLDHLKIESSKYKITKKDAIKLLDKVKKPKLIFYFDPPFGFKQMQKLIEIFENTNFFIGIFEMPIDKNYNFSYIYKEKHYGNIKIIMEKKYEQIDYLSR